MEQKSNRKKQNITKTDHRSCFRKKVVESLNLMISVFFVSWSFMSEMTVGLFGKHRALDELHNQGILHYPEPSEDQNPQHRCVYHASAYTNIPYITTVELLLQSHGHLILLACFVGFSSIQFLIIPFQTRRFFVNLKWITCPYPQNNPADFPSQNPVNLVLLDPGGLGQEHRGQVGLGSYGRNGHQP